MNTRTTQIWRCTLLLVFGGLRASCEEGKTNAMFVTFAETQNSGQITPEQLVSARGSGDCLPAEVDADGNWGSVVEGFQLSIRFEKKSFLTNEAIKVILLLRNTTNHIIGYNAFFGIGKDSPICDFVITNSTQQGAIKSTSTIENLLDGGIRWFELHPQTQRKYETFLNQKRNGLSEPGECTIVARGTVPRSDGKGHAVIESGKAIIKIDQPTVTPK